MMLVRYRCPAGEYFTSLSWVERDKIKPQSWMEIPGFFNLNVKLILPLLLFGGLDFVQWKCTFL